MAFVTFENKEGHTSLAINLDSVTYLCASADFPDATTVHYTDGTQDLLGIPIEELVMKISDTLRHK